MRRPAVLLAVAVFGAACISERVNVTGVPGALDCSMALDSAAIGSVGVVVIRDFAFHPAELRVQPGTRVTWINCEPGNAASDHTATADDGSFGSPLLSRGQVYSAVLEDPGAMDYHCEPHPFMRGRVVVE